MIEVYTDASGRENVTVCGFMSYRKNALRVTQTRVLYPTTVAQGEMLAVLLAFFYYPNTRLHIHSDSLYVVNTLLGHYTIRKHKSLWQEIIKRYQSTHSVISHVKAHQTNERNNQVDQRVRAVLRQYMKEKKTLQPIKS